MVGEIMIQMISPTLARIHCFIEQGIPSKYAYFVLTDKLVTDTVFLLLFGGNFDIFLSLWLVPKWW